MQKILIEEANRKAKEIGLIKRQRIISGSSLAIGLVMGWLAKPQATLAELGQSLGNAETPITRRAVEQRLNQPQTADFFKTLLEAAIDIQLESTGVPPSLLTRFSHVYLVDSTIITLPNSLSEVWRGSGGNGAQACQASLKVSVKWDVGQGGLKQIELTDGTYHDGHSKVYREALSPQSLMIQDLGYFKLAELDRIDQEGAYWLTRYKLKTNVYTPHGEPLVFAEFLPPPRLTLTTRHV